MSFFRTAAAIRLVNENIGLNDRAVLVYLADRENEETGLCNPSYETIANDLHISQRHVGTIIRRLQSLNIITVQNTGKSANVFGFCFSKLLNDNKKNTSCCEHENISPNRNICSSYNRNKSSSLNRNNCSYKQRSIINNTNQEEKQIKKTTTTTEQYTSENHVSGCCCSSDFIADAFDEASEDTFVDCESFDLEDLEPAPKQTSKPKLSDSWSQFTATWENRWPKDASEFRTICNACTQYLRKNNILVSDSIVEYVCDAFPSWDPCDVKTNIIKYTLGTIRKKFKEYHDVEKANKDAEEERLRKEKEEEERQFRINKYMLSESPDD